MRPSIGPRQNIRPHNLRLGFRRQAARFQPSEGIIQLSEPFPTNKRFPIIKFCELVFDCLVQNKDGPFHGQLFFRFTEPTHYLWYR